MTTALRSSSSSSSSSSSLPSWRRVARLSIATVAAIHIMASAPLVVAQKEDKEKDDETSANRATACMDKPANSCLECLNDSTTGQLDAAGCGWAPGFGCLSSCSIIADADCYAGNDKDKDGTEICARADADVANEDFCYGMTDCASCTGAVLPDGSGGTCHWFGEEFGVQGGGWCGAPGCNMIGCGSPTCPGDTVSTSGSTTTTTTTSNGNGNGNGNHNNNADSDPEEIDIVSPPPPADSDNTLDEADAEEDTDADTEDKQASTGASSSSSSSEQPPPPPPESTKPGSGPASTDDSSSPSTTATAVISEGFSTAIGAYTGTMLMLLGLAPIWWAV
mmetsp:Transcript_29751/g.70004  ORF Transcript_29751/g.70004 Transcript_29751/m.70004 type:complete len:335 (+) Transcript_29751:257-1261(+)